MRGRCVLGDFLRTLREQLRPADVGMETSGRRRVPGLRREEVARMAGISLEYYIRLEQGRERNPSMAVLDALAEALVLDSDQIGHLYELARPKSRHLSGDDTVPWTMLRLLDALHLPAVIQNKYMDILGSNQMAQALSPNLRPGVNRLRAAFLDPRERELQRDWEETTANSVAQLRAAIGSEFESPAAFSLVSELMTDSTRFRELWCRHEVQRRAINLLRLRHPQFGDIELYREKLLIAGTEGLVLVIFHAEPDSASAAALSTLAAAVSQSPG